MRCLRRPSLALLAWLSSSLVIAAAQGGSPRSSNSTGSSVMSPSVIGSSIITRDEGGTARLELLVLWRGSPGWFMRQTGLGSSMGGGSAARRSFGGGGMTNLSVREGGLSLTATFNAATRVARILDEDVPLRNANVILVDQVDDPSGPRVLKSIAVTTPLGPSDVLNGLFLATPELLDYLRCGAHVPDPQNRSSPTSDDVAMVLCRRACGRVCDGDAPAPPRPGGHAGVRRRTLVYLVMLIY